jgi:hypothetical protein
MRGLSDPSWKKGPTYDKPTDSEHALDIEPAGIDIDGVGVDEAEQVDGTPLVATFETFSCLRDGCDEAEKRRHVYVLEDVPDHEVQIIKSLIGWTDDPTEDDVIDYIATHLDVIDYDEAPVVGFDDESDVYLTPRLTITDEAHGPCYGHEEPSPEPYGL